jgi:hypothetical protein
VFTGVTRYIYLSQSAFKQDSQKRHQIFTGYWLAATGGDSLSMKQLFHS